MSFTTKGKEVELFEDQQKTQDEQDEDGLQACKNFRDGSAFFSPPIQRQNWEDTQILPHVNWGDLFFDLFYVAAAFNLATLIKSDPSFKGLCYFFALFGPVFTIFWQTKMMYDARYALPNDTIHGIITVLQLCALATSILHIRPLEYMSRGADHPEMFLYCLGIVLGNLINMLLHFEIKFIWVVGQVAATRAALRELKFEAYSCILNCGALIYAAVLFYGKGGTSQQEYHGPVIILAIALFSKPLILTLIFRFYYSPNRNFKTSTVPMNIEFSIHRYGEWTMLMLGESILVRSLCRHDMLKDVYCSFRNLTSCLQHCQ
jgi:low temperature requirement protein LtrA